MNENKSYPRLRGKKLKFKKSRKLREQMRYNSIENDKRIKFFERVETPDTFLVHGMLREAGII